MPDKLDLTLHPELERSFHRAMDHEISLGRFDLSHGRAFVIEGGADASRSSLVSELKEKLEHYVDFEAGGLKVIETNIRGARARFVVAPGWEMAPEGVKGKSFGGPSITLKFSLSW